MKKIVKSGTNPPVSSSSVPFRVTSSILDPCISIVLPPIVCSAYTCSTIKYSNTQIFSKLKKFRKLSHFQIF